VLPNFVKSLTHPSQIDTSGNIISPEYEYKSLNYLGFVPLLIKGYQTQKVLIDTLNNRLTQLEQTVASCCNMRISNSNTGSNDFPVKQTIDLSSSGPILYQNQPNPFDKSCIIRYFIPENAINPKIIFQDETGRTINETAITEKGQNSIQVNSQLLNSGIYTYSMQIDGKIIDSKKMLKTK